MLQRVFKFGARAMQATMREPGAVAAGFILLPVYEYCLKVRKVKPRNVAEIQMATRLLKFLLSTSALQRGAKDEATSIAHAIQISVSLSLIHISEPTRPY